MPKQKDRERKGGVREKTLVAASSVVAAIFLAATKLVIGLLTGSLGIMAEAAHSGLDLLAAGITFYSVRISDRPPDETHHYGHGKVENLSALAETILLFITCGWIVYEAMVRLFFRPAEIEVTFWSYLVMGISIVINVGRSRALMRTAKKFSSQALEADALHFETDVWSSWVVIGGLIAVSVSHLVATSSPALATWLSRADAVAALGVSVIILFVSYKLGKRTIGMLLDTAPRETAVQIRDLARRLPGVTGVQRLRVRQGGAATFVDMILEVPADKTFEESHEIARLAEAAVRQVAPGSDVMVHVEPAGQENRSLMERVRSVARRQGLNLHDVYLDSAGAKNTLEVHVEVPDDITVSQAHDRATSVEESLLKAFPELADVIVHIDPVGDRSLLQPSEVPMLDGMHDKISDMARLVDGIKECHSVTVLRSHSRLITSFHCTVSPDFPVSQAHELTDRLETLLRERLKNLERVTIHLEPCDESCTTCSVVCVHKPG